jgi:hypothetical protein
MAPRIGGVGAGMSPAHSASFFWSGVLGRVAIACTIAIAAGGMGSLWRIKGLVQDIKSCLRSFLVSRRIATKDAMSGAGMVQSAPKW